MLGLSAAIGILGLAPTPTLLDLAPGTAAALVAVLLATSVGLSYRITPEPDVVRHPLGAVTRSPADAVVAGLTPWLFVILTLVGSGVFLIV